jgi:hypothetical protein
LLQSATGVVAAKYGLAAVLMFVAAALAVGALTFLVYTRPASPSRHISPAQE